MAGIGELARMAKERAGVRRENRLMLAGRGDGGDQIIPIWSQCRRSGHFSQYDAFAMRRGRQMAWLGCRRSGIAPMSLRARFAASAALATASFPVPPSALAASHPVQVTR